MCVSDVPILSTDTIHGLVLELLDAEGLYVRPGREWIRQLLHDMRLSQKNPAKCAKQHHNLFLQKAKTHRFFIKLCWLVSTHVATQGRVVNIETRRPDRVVPPRRGASSRAIQRGILARYSWCRSYTLARQTPFCTTRLGWRILITLRQPNYGRTLVDLEHASTHARETAMKAAFSHVVL